MRPASIQKITVMKKILAVAASLILVVVSANSQSEKKEPPPPPPPKQIDEKVKFTPPKIVKDEEVNSSTKTKTEKSKETTPPKVDITKFTPPKIVKDEEVQMKELPVITVNGKLADDFYKRNPSVSDISRQGNIITLKRNDGTTEKYDMNKKEEHKSFTEKYGVSPIPPPPPPPKKIS